MPPAPRPLAASGERAPRRALPGADRRRRSLRAEPAVERRPRRRNLQLPDAARALSLCTVCRRGAARRGGAVMASIDDVRERLTEVRPAGLNRDIVSAGLVREVNLEAGAVT